MSWSKRGALPWLIADRRGCEMNGSVWPERAESGRDSGRRRRNRLQELSYSVSGDAWPKQFCALFGGKSLLEHTRERMLPLFQDENTLFDRAHEAHLPHAIGGRAVEPNARAALQPRRRGGRRACGSRDPSKGHHRCDHRLFPVRPH